MRSIPLIASLAFVCLPALAQIAPAGVDRLEEMARITGRPARPADVPRPDEFLRVTGRPAPTDAPRPEEMRRITGQPSEAELLSHRHYKAKDGHEVHSPARSTHDQVPAGASAKCGDGTYSFSQSRRGTCSHHGGVRAWI